MSWEKATRTFFVYGVTVAVLNTILAAFVVLFGQFEGSRTLSALLVFPYTIAFIAWSVSTRRLLASLGDDPHRFRRDPLFIATIGVLIIIYLLDAAFGSGTTVVFVNKILAAGASICELFVVRSLGERIRGIKAGEITPDLAASQAPILPNTDRYDVLPSAAEISDDFWTAVARLAAAQDVVLLETSTSMARRWIVIPAGGDIRAASITPGTVLTLFPSATVPLPPAAEYYGLIQTTPGGPIRFQLVLPTRVGAFESQSRSAARSALYSPNDPTAVAVAVSEQTATDAS